MEGDQAMGTTKDIRETVKAELSFDPLVDDSGITVKNMNGDVALNGTVPCYPHYQEAAIAARRVQGVTSVHNHLKVVLPPSDFRDDAMLTTAANNALALNATVPSEVEASATDGNIWLTGMVSYGLQRAAAEQTVAGLIGVRNIANDIEILSEVEAADVTSLVRGAIARYALIGDDSDVKVDASDGTITLTGHVHSWAEHDVVLDAAWMGIGVLNVRDNLVITG
jgi:osmotically-inducible protein OsmY